MNLTIDSLAQARIQAVVEENENPNLKLRIYIANRLPDLVKFGFVFDENATTEDTVVAQNGLSVIVENDAAALIGTATLTYDGRSFQVNAV